MRRLLFSCDVFCAPRGAILQGKSSETEVSLAFRRPNGGKMRRSGSGAEPSTLRKKRCMGWKTAQRRP